MIINTLVSAEEVKTKHTVLNTQQIHESFVKWSKQEVINKTKSKRKTSSRGSNINTRFPFLLFKQFPASTASYQFRPTWHDGQSWHDLVFVFKKFSDCSDALASCLWSLCSCHSKTLRSKIVSRKFVCVCEYCLSWKWDWFMPKLTHTETLHKLCFLSPNILFYILMVRLHTDVLKTINPHRLHRETGL